MSQNVKESLQLKSLYELSFLSGIEISPGAKYALAQHIHIVTDPAATAEPTAEPTANATDTEAAADPDAKPAPDEIRPRYHSDLFLYDLEEGGAPVQLTRSATSNRSGQFSPDAKQIAFISDRKNPLKPAPDTTKTPGQLCVMSLTGGEAEVLTDYSTGVSGFCWSADGKRIAFTSRADAEEPPSDKPKEIDRLSYKWDGQGFTPTQKTKIFIVEVATGYTYEIYESDFAPRGLCFGETSHALYFAHSPDEIAEDKWYAYIYKAEIQNPQSSQGPQSPRGPQGRAPGQKQADKHEAKITTVYGQPVRINSFSITEDETEIIYLAEADPQFFSSPSALWKAPLTHNNTAPTTQVEATRITDSDLDLNPLISGDSKYGGYPYTPTLLGDGTVIANANRKGHSGLVRIDLNSGAVENICDPESQSVVTGFATDPQTQRTIATIETPSTPGELFEITADTRKQLSELNKDFVQRYDMAESGPARWLDHADGATTDTGVQYWTMSPNKAREDNAIVVQVHGGPHTNYGYGYMFEFQLLAAHGYTVVYGNPRGSSSYGSKHASAILGAYGTVDADDILAIARDAKEKHVDTNAPIHLTGGSYGGFMTNWLIGQTTEFRSAVTQRSICNWLSMYGTSDIGPTFTSLQIGGNPWDDTEKLWQQSPLANVTKVETPTLIIHAEEDHRCPMEQAEQWFKALRFKGVDTELIRYPAESHGLSRGGRPDRRVHRLEAIINWFQTHP